MKDFGVLVPIVTPCARSGEIDFEGLRSVCADMENAGCGGIFVLGSTGRSPWFSLKARTSICSAVADTLGGRLPLYAGCMASGIESILENARAMADAGARVAVVTAPVYFRYNQEEVASIFLAVADRSPLPVLIYDIPAFTGMKLDAAMVERISQHGNIVGLKDSSSDVEGFRALSRALSGASDFLLFQGKEHLIAESIANGASGFVVSLIHIAPGPFVRLYAAARAGEKELSATLQGKITDVMGVVESSFKRRPETSTLFHLLNIALRERGVCSNIVLEHEGDCPDWLLDRAHQVVSILAES